MPPKAAKTPSTEQEFLATCIRHLEEKPKINFEAVANELGMSKGGASNKWRAFTKAWEESGLVHWGGTATAGNKSDTTKAATKRKVGARGKTSVDSSPPAGEADENGDDTIDEEESPKKKSKGTKKTTTKDRGTAKKSEDAGGVEGKPNAQISGNASTESKVEED